MESYKLNIIDDYKDLSLSNWTVYNTANVGITGDKISSLGASYWNELAYCPFQVNKTGQYNISFDYEIIKATCGDWASGGFGIFFTPNDVTERMDTWGQQTFYMNEENRVGQVLVPTNSTVENVSGNVSFNVNLEPNHTYYMYYPGGALYDGVRYTFFLRNFKAIKDAEPNTICYDYNYVRAEVIDTIQTNNTTLTGNGTVEYPIGIPDDLLYIGHCDVSKTANANSTVAFPVMKATVPSGYTFVGWLGGEVYSGPSYPAKCAGYVNCHDGAYWNTLSARAWYYFNAKGTYNARFNYLCVRS